MMGTSRADMKRLIKIWLLALLCCFIIVAEYCLITDKMLDIFSKTSKNELPHLYIITPTYRRPSQVPDLVRLSQTLRLVPSVTWLVVEDGSEKLELVKNVLKKSGLDYQYLLAPMPAEYRKETFKPKGVSNRNRGLQWVRENTKSGVLYFADDDNTYDTELFEEIRKTKTVSLFPVGLVTRSGLSAPILTKDCSFRGFYDGWIANRRFPVDMAGFAVSVNFLLKRPQAGMPYISGYEEDGFLSSLAPFNPQDAQFLASCGTKILVWHTQTVQTSPAVPLNITFDPHETNIGILNKLIV